MGELLRSLLALPIPFGAFPQLDRARGQLAAWLGDSLLDGNAPVDPREEVLILFAESRGEVLDGGNYIRLRADMFRPNGRWDGHYEGILATAGRADPEALMRQPAHPEGPIDQPGEVESIPLGGNAKVKYVFGNQSSFTGIGPTIMSLVPLLNGSAVLIIAGMGRLTDGTGRYEGARGMKADIGSALLPEGADLNQTGATFHARLVHTFRLVAKRNVGLPPASGVVKTGGMHRGDSGKTQGEQPGTPVLPEFPTGVNPETYCVEPVEHQLKRAAYFTIFNVGNPQQPNIPLLSSSGEMVGVEVNEDLHRFEIAVAEPSTEGGLQVTNRLGEAIGSVHIRWLIAPEDFAAAPGHEPPPTPLDPSRSQRFITLDGRLRLRDRQGSGIDGFGSGRTFPIPASGKPQLRIAAVIDTLEGHGRLRGLKGILTINGTIQPPDGLALSLVGRFVDPRGVLLSRKQVAPLRVAPGGDAESLFLSFLGEPNRDQTWRGNASPAGSPQELLRLVDVGFEAGKDDDLRSRTTVGRVVGSVSGTLLFNPLAGDPASPIPLQTQNGLFTFWDRQQRTIGTVTANVVEGRAFRTEYLGTPVGAFRFGGFGPFIEGTGQFAGVEGMLSVNGAVSVYPRTVSNLYTLRISDPQGRFRATCQTAWA
jgi:hypothetical protein